MTNIEGAVIYCRVSSDQSGRAQSVAQQEADCRRTCEVEGWPVIDVVVDNDIGASRYSQGTRPGFLRLRALLGRGVVLVSWESSRITRKLGEFAELRDFCESLGVQWFVGGRLYDLSDPQDSYMLGIAAQNAELEVALSRKRIMRSKDASAARGVHNGWMPFGYVKTPDGWQVDPERAAVVREAVRRLLAGESLRSLAKEFGERKLPAPSRGTETASGSGWEKIGGKGLRSMILSPTYAGIHVRHRRDNGVRVEVSRVQGNWEPIITSDEHYRLVAMLNDPARKRTWGSQITHLLSGIAVCGVCGKGVKHSNMKSDFRPRYRCPDSHVKRAANELDDYVRDTIIDFFTEDVLLAGQVIYGDDDAAREAAETARALRQRFDAEIIELSKAKVSATTRARMVEQMEAELMPKIEEAEEKARQVSNPVLQKFDGNDPLEVWKSLTILERRTVVRECLRIVVLRVEKRNPRRAFDPESVRITTRKEVPISSRWWNRDE
ncbi:recombinase family protein [Rhodococcus erythropolis]|nr:recombinase family protein [Rhodococcus erythropolis]MCQ4127938.1 recombinase family protein [Rhodococcus erythropolis]